MAANSEKLVAVVGGTGRLGSSVAFSLHKNPNFKVRVLSRNTNTPKSGKIIDRGIDVITANNWDQDGLLRAFRGCWAVFINVDSDNPEEQWKSGKKPTEFDMGRNIVDSAVGAGVKHIVHASLPYASVLTNGKVPMISFDDKARTSEYILDCVKSGKLETGCIANAGWFLEDAFDPKYVQTFGGFAMITDDEGYLTWKTPSMGNDPESVPWLSAADDYGDVVHGILLDPPRWNGQHIDVVSESLSFADMTATFQYVTGKKARYIKQDQGNLRAGDATKTEEVNGLFDLMHELKGNFFDGKPTEHENAKTLKSAACRATGREDTLMSVAEFFKKYAT